MPASATMPQIVICPTCGAKNRVRPQADDKQSVCGRCRTPLPTEPARPITVTDVTFGELVERSSIPVLVDMWAPWCGPCRALAPTIDALAAEFTGRALVAKLNTDDNPQTAGRFRIDSIPTLLIFRDAKLVDRLVGMLPKDQIAQRLAAVL